MKACMDISKRVVCLLLLFMLLLGVSCNGAVPNGQETEAKTESEAFEKLTIGNDGLYTIVYPYENTSAWRIAKQLALKLKLEHSINLEVLDDRQAEHALEILVADTGRADSAAAKQQLGNQDILITVIEKKLIITHALHAGSYHVKKGNSKYMFLLELVFL